jgi:hypothetical protein
MNNTNNRKWGRRIGDSCSMPVLKALSMAVLGVSSAAVAAPAEIGGYIENDTHYREGRGLSKFRNTLQLEMNKDIGARGIFSSINFNGIFRATYDGVYDLNDGEWGDEAGGAIQLQDTLLPPPSVPHGGGIVLPGGDFSNEANPNEGLEVLGEHLHDPDGGVTFGVPVRPCSKDSRGCIDDYMDADKNELRFPEFNDRWDFIRELYLDAAIDLDNGRQMGFKLGKQQIVWGRTDLFRVLDVLNPVDYSRNNIYDELEDTRIPMWMLEAEYRLGATETFDDLNFSLVWNFDKFRPHNLGQGGTPNQILDAGSFFRGMNNCWEYGCTVSNFAPGPEGPPAGLAATDFPAGVIGIRKAHLPDWSLDNTQIGIKIEGLYKDVGFSVNALHYRSQLPSLRGGIPADNPFTPEIESEAYPGLIAFDIHFPVVDMIGGSLDYYSDPIKSVFRMEAAYTSGEEFPNTLEPELYSDSDVVRWVLGIDRDTFIPFLNDRKAFLISGQLFGQHLLDHEKDKGPFGPVGMPDWEDNYIATLLIKGWYKNNRVSPQILLAHDFKAEATVFEPSVEWLVKDNLRFTAKWNTKFGTGARKWDDCRSCNPFPPYTGGWPQGHSLGLGGYEPLGRFRSGPIGMAREENELGVSVRYSF